MRILILSSVYPTKDSINDIKTTNVVHYFAKEWIRQNHEVLVVSNVHKYPLVHKLPDFIREKLSNKIHFHIGPGSKVLRMQYILEGVKVYRLPILKLIPHGDHSKISIKRQVQKIKNILEKNSFVPEIIVGHWVSPQIQLIKELKKTYRCRTALVFHGLSYLKSPKFDINKYIESIDSLGCRSKHEAEEIQNILKLKKEPFICYSGVPDRYIEKFNLNENKFNDIKKWNISCVCRLIKYKNVDKLIMALAEITDVDWELNIIGDGAERTPLEKLAKNLKVDNKVIFHGRVSRDRVMELVAQSHCFALISKGEVFGLVYLEAMAASSIAIGSLKEGIDGIIIDGKNGILCEAGNKDDFRDKIKGLMTMSVENRKRMAREGYETAKAFADSKVAKRYISDIMEW